MWPSGHQEDLGSYKCCLYLGLALHPRITRSPLEVGKLVCVCKKGSDPGTGKISSFGKGRDVYLCFFCPSRRQQ
ncbi:hypothetical protein ILYODFUR_006857 [Ilyodon furcidens]|uniref:Uncharacterized protein n=1 Tax=Ilyodon furcidens TaxID=33524 RepID=A0ABV0TGL5_9TELE